METERLFRADVGAYVVMVVISSLLCAFLVMAGMNERRLAMTIMDASTGVALVVFSLLWVVRFKIRVTDEMITFRSLFAGTRSLPVSAISKAQLKWEIGNGMQGPLRLILIPKRGSGYARLSINAKVFSREAIMTVLDASRRHGTADDGDLLDGVVKRALRHKRSRRSKPPSASA